MVRKNVTASDFIRLAYDERLPNKEVARILGVHVSHLANLRKKFNLPPRGWANGSGRIGSTHSPETRKKLSDSRKGKRGGVDNPFWKGGRRISTYGYVLVRIPGGGEVFEHRLVMAEAMGRELLSSEIVHHINGDKTDNRIENLEITSRKEHAKHHFPKGSRFGIHC